MSIIKLNLNQIFIISESCSHSRAWQLWAASLLLASDPTAFLSVKSKKWHTFVAGNNYGSRTVSMGINCPRE